MLNLYYSLLQINEKSHSPAELESALSQALSVGDSCDEAENSEIWKNFVIERARLKGQFGDPKNLSQNLSHMLHSAVISCSSECGKLANGIGQSQKRIGPAGL